MAGKWNELRRRRSRHWWLTTGAALVAVAAFSIVYVAASSAVIATSAFEGNDGNMLVGGNPTPPGNGAKDWKAGVTVTSTPDGTGKTDDSIGSSKEDDPYPQLVTQSTPPKDDFTSVHLATEIVGTDVYLYQSSIRSAPNGSANENVELNQGTTVGPNNSNISPNGVTPWRTVGDRLITFDFGGGTATITILKWNTSNNAACADSNDSQPCWDSQESLTPNNAEGAVNDGQDGRTGALAAADNPLTGAALAVNEFQEMSVNLTGTGILPPTATGCETFSYASIKSRSSGATGTFNSDLKDIVVSHRPITNCGSIVIKKVTNPSPNTTDSFTFTGDAAGSIKDGETITTADLVPGTYSSTEAAAAGFDLTNISCDDANSATASSGNTGTRTATFKLDAGETVICTFTNTKQGEISIKKLTDPSGDPQAFSFAGDITAWLKDGETSDHTVAAGTYHVTESAAEGWGLTSISCDGEGSSGDTATGVATFVVAAGQHVTCTYTNRKQATIKIVKNTLGGDGAFLFSGDTPADVTLPEGFGSFQLETAGLTRSQVFTVVPGDYTVAEGAQEGWALTGLSCTTGEGENSDNGQVDAEDSSQADIHVTSGGFVQCTFTNTKLATLTVRKNVDNSNGGGSKAPGDFSLHVTTGGLELPNSPALGSSSGTAYSGLLPGTYKVSEDAVAGYSLTAISGCLADGSVVLEAGARVTCTLTNTSAAPPVIPPAPPVTPPASPAPPAPKVDLQITKTGTPNPAVLGNQVTWTLVVSNNGPNGATGVTVADPVPAGTTFVSAATSHGSCAGGVVVSCQLGSLAVGASVTITLVTTAGTTGTITNTATTVATEQETNTANNTASASVVVNGPFVPPAARPTSCTAVTVSPKTLSVGRKSVLTIKVAQNGKAAKGIRIKIKGSTLAITAGPSNAKGMVKTRVQPKRAGIVTFAPVSTKGCTNPRVGVVGVFTPPVTG